MVRVVVAGGSGFIGQRLTASLLANGYDVVVLSRKPNPSLPDGAKIVRWPAEPSEQHPPAGWMGTVDGAKAVVNLAGASIGDGRWTAARKRLILTSRVQATAALVAAMRMADNPPELFVSSSAVGFYGNRGDAVVTERDRSGTDFLSEVCVAWENAALPAQDLGVRTVLLRTGIVLERHGGALQRLLLPFRLFAGGPLGSGRQWWPWIHLDDLVGIVRFVLEQPAASGPLNATAPNPVTNREFARILGKVLGRPSLLPVPAPLLRLALGGEMAEAMLLGGQRALPQVAQSIGYKFQYPELERALRAILRANNS